MGDSVRVIKGGASMYVDLLRRALASDDGELDSATFLDHVVACRLAMLTSARAPDVSAYHTLATDVAYDSALLRLCHALALATNVSNFTQPSSERHRLERALSAIGIDLTERSRQRQLDP
jgi:hypothetical protein